MNPGTCEDPVNGVADSFSCVAQRVGRRRLRHSARNSLARAESGKRGHHGARVGKRLLVRIGPADKLGLKGILLYSNLAGRFPDEADFQPLFAEAERKGVPILLHPAAPVTWDATKDYDMSTMLGLMFDTTIALCRLILSGTLERHPKLKLVCPHVGGALPYLIGRVDHQTMVLKRGAEHIRRAPGEYLKRVYFDTVSPIALAIKYGYDFVGPERMLYSSDHPWVDPAIIIDRVKSLQIPEEHEARLFAGNARKLFGIED